MLVAYTGNGISGIPRPHMAQSWICVHHHRGFSYALQVNREPGPGPVQLFVVICWSFMVLLRYARQAFRQAAEHSIAGQEIARPKNGK